MRVPIIFAAVVVLAAFTACARGAPTSHPGAGMDHRVAIERYYRAYRERDRAALEALLTDDFRFRSSFGAFDGRDAMLDAIWPMVGRSWATNLRIYGEPPEFVVLYENEAEPGVEHPRNHMAERIRFAGDRIAEIEVFIGPEE
jgi:ketosteroid isomerase-like protein